MKILPVYGWWNLSNGADKSFQKQLIQHLLGSCFFLLWWKTCCFERLHISYRFISWLKWCPISLHSCEFLFSSLGWQWLLARSQWWWIGGRFPMATWLDNTSFHSVGPWWTKWWQGRKLCVRQWKQWVGWHIRFNTSWDYMWILKMPTLQLDLENRLIPLLKIKQNYIDMYWFPENFCAIWVIHPKFILTWNLAKYRSSIKFVPVIEPFCNFAQHTVASPPWSAHNSNTIRYSWNKLWANEISQNVG